MNPGTPGIPGTAMHPKPLATFDALATAPQSSETLATILVQGDSRPGGDPAETSSAPSGGSPFGGGFNPLVLIAIFAIFYFVMIAPERKNRRQREDMLSKLKKGDEVMLTSGLYAKVATVQDDVVVLQIADGVRAKYSRSAIQSVVEAAAEEG